MSTLNWGRTWLLSGLVIGAAVVSQISPAGRSVAFADDTKLATFEGQIILEGDIPKIPPATTDADPKAADLKICGVKEVPQEKLVVDPKSKGIANVVVYLQKAPAGMPDKFKKPAEAEVVFDQKNCQFLPHVLVVQAGQKVLVKSEDDFGHNTHLTPFANQPFNSAIKAKESKGVEVPVKLGEKLPMQVKCDIHPWMTAWWVSQTHPYVAVTDKDGKFKIENLPAGKHEFVVWQESVGYINRKLEVNVTAGKNPDAVTIKVPVAKFSKL